MSDTLTFQQWFNVKMQGRQREWTKIQLKHAALQEPAWAETDHQEMLSQWLDRKLLAAMKKVRADNMPMAGFSATIGPDGSRYIIRPELWLFPDWKYNILLRMKGTKRDFARVDKIYDYGVIGFSEQVQAQQWPRPSDDPHFYWNLPEINTLDQ